MGYSILDDGPQQEIRFRDVDYTYEIGRFDDYLICLPHDPEAHDDYVEIHMGDCSEYERRIFDFLTEMSTMTETDS